MAGLLGDFLGNLAGAGLSMVQRDNKIAEEEALLAKRAEIEQSRQMNLAKFNADLDLKKLAAIEDLKAEREDRQANNMMSAQLQAESDAPKIGDDRRYAKFKADMKAAGYGEGMTEDEIRGVFDSTYNNRAVSAESGGSRYVDKRGDSAADYLTAARRTGQSGLIASAMKEMAEQRAAQTSEDKAARDERLAALKEASEQRRDRMTDARIDAMERGLDLRERQMDSRGAGAGNRTEALMLSQQLNAARQLMVTTSKTMPKAPDLSKIPGDSMKQRAMDEYKQRMNEWATSEDGQQYQEAKATLNAISKQFSANESGNGGAGFEAPRRATGDPVAGSGLIGATENAPTPQKLKELETQIADVKKMKGKGSEEVAFALEQQAATMRKALGLTPSVPQAPTVDRASQFKVIR
ncbi:hypothetical protein [Caudoviricetes sp.]|nr:hypothetical protein [Caudoviricetes sp.]